MKLDVRWIYFMALSGNNLNNIYNWETIQDVVNNIIFTYKGKNNDENK